MTVDDRHEFNSQQTLDAFEKFEIRYYHIRSVSCFTAGPNVSPPH